MNRRALLWPSRALAAVGAAGLIAAAASPAVAAPARSAVSPVAGAALPSPLAQMALPSPLAQMALPSPLTGATPHSAGTRSAAQAPALPRPSDLSAVAATSASNAWAVGFHYDGRSDQTLIERWNGMSWHQVISPDPGGSAQGASNQLNGAAATSARNAWAVGSWSDGTRSRMLILHWNGRSWRQQPSHSPGCLKDNDGLYSVTATSSTNAWAVGSATSCVFGDKITVIFHWNGTSWHEVTSPDPGLFHDNYLRGVTATSARDAWAVGFYFDGGPMLPLIVHWNGKSWTQVPCPDPIDADTGLAGVAATSATNAWAAGLAATGSLSSSEPLIFHWNGKSWTRSPAQDRSGEGLSAVTARPGRTPWAVGFHATASNPEQTLAERWNGTSWKPAASSNPGPSPHVDGLQGVALIPGGGAWAVGFYDNGSTLKALIEHWNGRSWRFQGRLAG